MTTQPATPREDDDRSSRALLYVLGEMSADESAAFEHLLATDQTTREEVAGCLRLATDVYAAYADQDKSVNGRVPVHMAGAHRPSPRHRWNPRVPIGAAIVASLLAALGLAIQDRIQHQGQSGREMATGRAQSDMDSRLASEGGAGPLVAIWSERLAESTRESAANETTATDPADASQVGELEGLQPTPAAGGRRTDSLAVSDQNAAAAEPSAADDLDVPSWLFDAVESHET